MWRIAFAWPSWLVYLLADLLLAIVGALVAVPLALLFLRPMISPVTGQPILNAPRWLYPWGNDEDGYDPTWYAVARSKWSRLRRMYAWAALRNSVNNLRFLPVFSVVGDPNRIRFKSRGSFVYLWQGAYSRLIWIRPSGDWLAIGWKLEHVAGAPTRVGFGLRQVIG